VTLRHPVAIGTAVLATLLITACSPTTYDSSLETTTPVAVTTTSLPIGSAAQLLPVMLTEVQGLSEKVAANKGDGETATLIEQLWAAMKPEIESARPELVKDFEFVVRRCRTAADRRRPADADRAYRNLSELVDNYLAS
jgi:hypothetical protein